MADLGKFINNMRNDKELKIKTVDVVHRGKKVLTYRKEPYSDADKQLMFSMTKSITSIAIGIAQDRGLLDINELITDIFEDELPNEVNNNLRDMRIRDLLLMASGVHYDSYGEIFKEENWVKAFLKQDFIHKPGTYFRYSTHCSHMLSAII